MEEKKEIENKKRDIDFYSDKHPLNSIYNRVLRNLYLKFDKYSIENHNKWIKCY